MVMRQCETSSCLLKCRHRRALWLIDHVPYCNACYEAFMETNFVDEHLIRRLSDDEDDFGGAVPRAQKNHACKRGGVRVPSSLQASRV